MSYSIDVYRGRLEPVRSFLDLGFFIAFFPQLVAGPIVRALTFLPQVFVTRVWSQVDVRACLVLFFIGFVKKRASRKTWRRWSISSSRIPWRTMPIPPGWACSSMRCRSTATFLAIPIWRSRPLGCSATSSRSTFNFPYFAAHITEFWRRWHISLSTWLRDYLYITLGGNRGSKIFTYRNLMLTMLLGGLWHGASWNFVIWGGLHGVALIAHREWQRATEGAAADLRG
jgi:alginate O-acetyltransferase complex protein AlgI